MTAICCLLAAATQPGCQPDGRISMQEMRDLEQEHERVADEPVPVDPARLALTDKRPYQLRIGDVVHLRMLGLQQPERYEPVELSARIHADSTIELPIVGRIPLAGLNLSEAETAIYNAHVPRVVRDMSVFIEVVQPENTTVLVSGAVQTPGIVLLPENKRNVLYAVAAAGGFSQIGSGLVTLRPVRPERSPATFDFRNVNDLRRALLDAPLESGDLLVVENAATNVIYTMGLVTTPGPIPVPPDRGISIIRAIAASGGLIDFLEPDEATLWRHLAGGRQVRVKLDLGAIVRGDAEDVELRAGDVLEIPHTAKTRVRSWFVQNVRLGPFGMQAIYDPVADHRARILQDNNNFNSAIRGIFINSLGNAAANRIIPP